MEIKLPEPLSKAMFPHKIKITHGESVEIRGTQSHRRNGLHHRQASAKWGSNSA